MSQMTDLSIFESKCAIFDLQQATDQTISKTAIEQFANSDFSLSSSLPQTSPHIIAFEKMSKIEKTTGLGGMPMVILHRTINKHDGGTSDVKVEVYLHGAHISSYSIDGDEVLFMSSKAVYNGKKALRGGIPICFPQFGPGKLPQHGFARTSEWNLVDSNEEKVEATFELCSSPETLSVWPHVFRTRYIVSINQDGGLHVGMSVKNESETDMEFTVALHNYFRVSGPKLVGCARIQDLKGVKYVDRMRSLGTFVEEGEVSFEKETDRNYVDTPSLIRLNDGDSRVITLHKSDNLPDAVVWNPWIEKAAAMGDFGDDEYVNMVCIEAGCVGTPNIAKVPAHGEWECWQEINCANS